MELTRLQKQAAERIGRNLVVSAGAGTGKTAVLVARFVNLVQRRTAAVNQILTITFTDKAAEEMKRRIADSFQHLGMRAEKAAVETAYVSTIHSFCSRLIRENPFAAGVDPRFEILDEIDRQLMLTEIFDELIAEGDSDFLELVEQYGEGVIRRAITSYVDLCRSLGRETEYVDQLLDEPGILREKARAFADKRAREVTDLIQERVGALASLKASGRWEEKRQQVVALGDSVSDLRSFRDAAVLLKPITTKVPTVGKRSGELAACLEVREQLCEIGTVLKDAAPAIFFDEETEERLLPCKVALLRGTALFWRKYGARKRERGVLDYEDLQLTARRLLRDDASLRAEYAERFRFVLVDEFQDINGLQEELIGLLTSGKNLFVVGDACQSIYGFRNADVEIFRSLIETSRSSPKTHDHLVLNENFRSGQNLLGFFNFFFSRLLDGKGAEFHPLRHARAEKEDAKAPSVEIMLFEQQKEEAGQLEDIEEVRQRESRAVAGRIWKAVHEGEITVYDPASGGCRSLEYGDVAVLCRTRASYAPYSEALAELGVPYYAVGGQSFYEKQEIADLVNLLEVIENPLRDIPLAAVLRSPFVGISDDTLFFLRHGAGTSGVETVSVDVRRESSPSRDVDNEIEPPYLLNALREVSSISEIPSQEKERVLHFLEMLNALARQRDSTPLHILMERAVKSSSFMTRLLASPGGAQKAANVSKFCDLLRQWESRRGGGIGEFLRFYDIMRRHGAGEEEAALETFAGDAVKLMTIHAAKGLEFPMMVIADLCRRFNFDTDRFLVSREMEIGCSPWQEGAPESSGRRLVYEERKERQFEEEKRLFYVAATRARDHLILAGRFQSEKACTLDRASCPMDWAMAIVGEQSSPPESGEFCDVQLGEANVRIFTDPAPEEAVAAGGAASLMQQQFDRIAKGQTISVSETLTEQYLPLVKDLLERVTSREVAKLDARPVEISVTQLMQFGECPYKFFLQEVQRFPGKDVMIELGQFAPGQSSTEEVTSEAGGGHPPGIRKRSFGELVHLCMEQVDFQAGEQQDLREIASRFFTSSRDAFVAEELMRRFVRSEEGKRLREARELHREIPVKALLDDVIVGGILDVLYLNKSGRWAILDFKTGSEPMESDSGNFDYEFQMRLYAFLVKEAVGPPPEEAMIYFLRSGKSLVVSTSLDNIEQTKRRVTEILNAISGGEFPKLNGNHCHQCEYGVLCASPHGND